MRLLTIQRSPGAEELITASGKTLVDVNDTGSGAGANGGTGGSSDQQQQGSGTQGAGSGQGTEQSNSSQGGSGTGTATPVAVDEGTVLKGIFGDSLPFKSYQQLRDQVALIPTLTEEKGKLTTLVEDYKPADDYVSALNAARKKGVSRENFERAQAIDTLKDNPAETEILTRMIKNNLTREEAEFMVKQEYRLEDQVDPEKPNEVDPAVRLARLKLKTDAQASFEYLSQFKAKVMESPVEAKQRDMQAAWGPLMPQLTGIDKLEIPTAEGNVEFKLSDEMRTDLAKYMNELIVTPEFNLMPAGEGQKQMAELLRYKVIGDNITGILDNLRDAIYVQHAIKKHNPATITGTAGQAAGQQGGTSTTKQMYDDMLRERGISPR